MRTSVEVRQLRLEATRFRDAIERCAGRLVSPGMHDFPYGACGDASLLLGHHLMRAGLGAFDFVSGYLPAEYVSFENGAPLQRNGSHAWLVRGQLVVDITADQFAGVGTRVVVEDGSAWHRAIRYHRRGGPADFRHSDRGTAIPLAADYETIAAALAGAAQAAA